MRRSPFFTSGRRTFTTAFLSPHRETSTLPMAALPGMPGDGPGGRLRGSGRGGWRGEIPAPAPLYQLDLGVLQGDAAHLDAEGEERLDTHPHPHLADADEGCRAEAWVVGDLEAP
jgi:hypothetical protein